MGGLAFGSDEVENDSGIDQIDTTMQLVSDYNDDYKSSEIEPLHRVEEVTLSAVGDIMVHNTQLYRAFDFGSRTFDFSDMLRYMEPYLKAGDLTVGNLETTLHGPERHAHTIVERDFYGYSGFPYFNTPDEVLTPIANSGIDLLATANNHCLDTGYDGMLRTIRTLDEAGIRHTGTFSSIAERKPYESMEAGGISFAVINYTYGTNGLSLDDAKMELVNTLEVYQTEKVERLYNDIDAASASGADYVVCMMHYGNEYWSLEDERFQKPLTIELIKRGVDIVLGGHPHVLQPVDLVTEVDGTVFDEPKIVIYSLGNFISSQRRTEENDSDTDIGVMFNIYFETIDGGNPRIKGIGFLPTYTIWQRDNITPLPVTDDDSLLVESGVSFDELWFSHWDISRLDHARKHTVPHLMQYLDGKGIVGEVYNDRGFYRYDLIREGNG